LYHLTGKNGRRDNLGAKACEADPNIWRDVPMVWRLATRCLCNLHKEDDHAGDDDGEADLGKHETVFREHGLAGLDLVSHLTSMGEFAQSAADLFS
jgi:hypothetical protein